MVDKRVYDESWNEHLRSMHEIQFTPPRKDVTNQNL